MKKMKRLVAILLTMAMVMGMSATAFADTKTKATITVKNAQEAKLGYVHVIKPNTETFTGWEFVNDDIANCYTDAFGLTDDDPNTAAPSDVTDIIKQAAIAMLVKAKDDSATFNKSVPAVNKATSTQINQALDNVVDRIGFTDMDDDTHAVTVEVAGVYAIKAVGKGYTYKAMAAYVGFGGLNIDADGTVTEYDYPSLMDATVEAKKVPTKITKKDNDPDNAVVIGQTVTYTVETSFPYFNQNDDKKYFAVSDKIVGASYVGLVDDPTTEDINEKTATVTIGGTSVEAEFVEDENTFTVILSEYIDNENINAGKAVVVTYDAVVDATKVENKASSHVGDEKYDSESIKLYTGKITLSKVDAKNNEIKLANAGFEVKLGDTVLTFEQKDTSKNVYTYKPDGTTTKVFTDANGELVVEGLDIGTYTFVEKTAPEGYSINENPKEIELDITDEGEANADGEAVKIYADADSIADTKLTALPSTGGIGTTIFTIVGCLIMVAAVGMFFISRRKENI